MIISLYSERLGWSPLQLQFCCSYHLRRGQFSSQFALHVMGKVSTLSRLPIPTLKFDF